jgi:transposase
MTTPSTLRFMRLHPRHPTRLGERLILDRGQLLAHLDYLDEAIAAVSAQIGELMVPFAAVLERLDAIPGVNRRTAEVLVAECGVDMAPFPSDRHLASWAGLCPGNQESAGKRKSGKTRKGNR